MLAQAFDGFVPIGLFFFLGMTFAPYVGRVTAEGFDLTGWPALPLLSIVGVLLLFYFVALESRFGVTLGKVVGEARAQAADGDCRACTPRRCETCCESSKASVSTSSPACSRC